MNSHLPCSIVMSTRNKASYLDRTLASIRSQDVPFDYEIITVDDGSRDNTRAICERYGARYFWLPNGEYRNPSKARNVGYRAARGDIVIAQSDDIVHITPNTIEFLTTDLAKGEFLLATVHNYKYDKNGPTEYVMTYCSNKKPNRRPYFFLGSLWRKDLYAVGGCDEEFVYPCFDDNWFADCLMHGLGLRVRFTSTVEAHHQSHPHPAKAHAMVPQSEALYNRKMAEARKAKDYVSSGGPWNLDEPPTEPPPILKPLPHQEPLPLLAKLPKHMNFFWAGKQMSLMRYLTLRSFRYHHPDWLITLHSMDPQGGKQWNSSETQDIEVYDGSDYSGQVADLGIIIQEWEPPVKGLSPAHASDLCQWELLGQGYGWYSDMDILYVKPIPYEQWCQSDALFCLSSGYITIGFIAASLDAANLFKTVYQTALDGYKNDQYQSAGACALYRLAGIGDRWGSVANPGNVVIHKLRTAHRDLFINQAPQDSVYPWNFKETSCIFNQNNPLPDNCIGVHWFGGNTLSQHWNCRLNLSNIHELNNTYTVHARKML